MLSLLSTRFNATLSRSNATGSREDKDLSRSNATLSREAKESSSATGSGPVVGVEDTIGGVLVSERGSDPLAFGLEPHLPPSGEEHPAH